MENVETFIKYLIEQLCDTALTTGSREASCACLIDLTKMISTDETKSAFLPFINQCLEALSACFSDESWMVRDAAISACIGFIEKLPTEAQIH